MDLLVFGASGRVGSRLCTYAATDGHRVTAFVREGSSAPDDARVVEGDVTDARTVAETVDDQDAVCSALGPETEADTSAFTAGTENISDGMEAAGVDRLVAVSAAAILQATPGRLCLDMPEFPDQLRSVATAHKTVYERLRDSALDWTLACPAQMPDGAPTNYYRTAVDYLPEGGQSISSGDVAAFVYDTAVGDEYRRQRVGLAY
ncbi:NAD(P)-dependent oxidoreductase [Haloarcula marina]|uniref:NAD(P)-dependent oxidoreductase n=1 Tax=Haloarcula marina TaxID=2961574 RepID=UPI0020B64EAC|nr:NAD(P)H-binding protein [Halomicroarcula marina]